MVAVQEEVCAEVLKTNSEATLHWHAAVSNESHNDEDYII